MKTGVDHSRQMDSPHFVHRAVFQLFRRRKKEVVAQQILHIRGQKTCHVFQFQKLFIELIGGAGADGVRGAQCQIPFPHCLGEAVTLIERVGEGAETGQQREEQKDQRSFPMAVAPSCDAHQRSVRADTDFITGQIPAQIRGEFRDLGVALFRIGGHGFPENGFQVAGDGDSEAVFRRFLESVPDSGHDLFRSISGEGVFQHDHFKEDRAHCEDIRSLVARISHDGFRREVLRGPDQGSPSLPCLNRPCDSPIHDVGFVVLSDHDIGRFQIAVHDVPAVGVFEGVADFQKDFEPVLQRLCLVERIHSVQTVVHGNLIQIRLQRDAVDSFHRQMESVFPIGVQRIDRHDGRMVELCGHPGLV